MKVYLIGPTLGLPDENISRFNSAAALLTAAGHEVVMPHDIIKGLPEKTTRRMKLVERLYSLGKCEGFHLIHGFAQERESSLEHTVAVNLLLTPVNLNSTNHAGSTTAATASAAKG